MYCDLRGRFFIAKIQHWAAWCHSLQSRLVLEVRKPTLGGGGYAVYIYIQLTGFVDGHRLPNCRSLVCLTAMQEILFCSISLGMRFLCVWAGPRCFFFISWPSTKIQGSTVCKTFDCFFRRKILSLNYQRLNHFGGNKMVVLQRVATSLTTAFVATCLCTQLCVHMRAPKRALPSSKTLVSFYSQKLRFVSIDIWTFIELLREKRVSWSIYLRVSRPSLDLSLRPFDLASGWMYANHGRRERKRNGGRSRRVFCDTLLPSFDKADKTYDIRMVCRLLTSFFLCTQIWWHNV